MLRPAGINANVSLLPLNGLVCIMRQPTTLDPAGTLTRRQTRGIAANMAAMSASVIACPRMRKRPTGSPIRRNSSASIFDRIHDVGPPSSPYAMGGFSNGPKSGNSLSIFFRRRNGT